MVLARPVMKEAKIMGLQPLMNLSEISFMLKPETKPMTIIMPKK